MRLDAIHSVATHTHSTDPGEEPGKWTRSKIPPPTKKRSFMWELGAIFDEMGSTRRAFFCLASEACRSTNTRILASVHTNSNVTNHLKAHGIVSQTTLRQQQAAATRKAERARRNADMEAAEAAGERDRYLKLSFVKTFIVGEFSPLVLGEKQHVRGFVCDLGAWVLDMLPSWPHVPSAPASCVVTWS